MNFQDKKITAKVERIAYPKADAVIPEGMQFYILKCDVGTCKGKLAHTPKKDECLVLEGKWEVSKYNGQPEFSFFHSSVFVPKDERSLLRYACEMTSGFGPAMEERIWEARGEDWRNIEYGDGIRGLTPRLLTAFQDTIQFLTTHETESKTISWLMSLGLTTNMAERAFEKWGVRTMEMVQGDCYILTQLPNYGFRDVDEHIRDHFNITKNDERRINACINYYISQLTQEDTVVDWNILYDRISKTIDADPSVINNAVRQRFANGSLVAFPKTGKLTTQKAYVDEAVITAFALNQKELTGHKARQPRDREFDLDETQLGAVQYALDHNFCIINGGAGCGKTSLVKALVQSLGEANVEICAFAGKAAARLKEATGYPAGTIHRMLGYQGDDRGFTRKSLAGYTVIVDEASMVASDLMAEIIKRNPSRLVLVGDEAQLPPVGSGQPFHDIIRLFPDRVKTLTTCYRNKEAVFKAALAIRAGQMPNRSDRSERESWECVSIKNPRDAHNWILKQVGENLVDFDTDIILCCRNGENDGETECSVTAFNHDIKDIVNHNADGSYKVAPGDRVINTKNDAEDDVWNGTTGRCRCFDTGNAMWVDLDFPRADGTKEVLIPKDKVRDWQLAYALTVHKSQGSQYRKVFFVCTRRDAATMLTRPMAYTAVTRTKMECNVVGDMSAFMSAIGKVENKMTVIQELARA